MKLYELDESLRLDLAEATGDAKFDAMLSNIVKGSAARKDVDTLRALPAKSSPKAALGKFGMEFIAQLEKLCRARCGINRTMQDKSDIAPVLSKWAEHDDGGSRVAQMLSDTFRVPPDNIKEFARAFNEHGDWPWQHFATAWTRGEWSDYKRQWTDGYLGSLGQGVAEGSLNEFAPSGGEGNGPFDYGRAIVEIGQEFVDYYQDEGAQADAKAIIKVGQTFISAGMKAGIRAFYNLDTQIRDHVAEQLMEQGFNVKQDIYLPYRQQMDKEIANDTAEREKYKSSPEYAARRADDLTISAIPNKPINSWSKPGDPAASVTMDRASKRDIKAEFEKFKQDLARRDSLKGVSLRFEITVGGKPVDINSLRDQGVAEGDTGDTPIDKMSTQELAKYLGWSVNQVEKDIELAREKAQDRARDMVGESNNPNLKKKLIKKLRSINPELELNYLELATIDELQSMLRDSMSTVENSSMPVAVDSASAIPGKRVKRKTLDEVGKYTIPVQLSNRRVLMLPSGASGNDIKDVLQYLIKNKDFSNLAKVERINGQDVRELVQTLISNARKKYLAKQQAGGQVPAPKQEIFRYQGPPREHPSFISQGINFANRAREFQSSKVG